MLWAKQIGLETVATSRVLPGIIRLQSPHGRTDPKLAGGDEYGSTLMAKSIFNADSTPPTVAPLEFEARPTLVLWVLLIQRWRTLVLSRSLTRTALIPALLKVAKEQLEGFHEAMAVRAQDPSKESAQLNILQGICDTFTELSTLEVKQSLPALLSLASDSA